MDHLELAQRAANSSILLAIELQERLDKASAALAEQRARNLELQRQFDEMTALNDKAIINHSRVTSLQSSVIAAKFNTLLGAYDELEEDFDELVADYLELDDNYRELEEDYRGLVAKSRATRAS